MATINIMALRHSAFYAPLLLTIKGGYLEKLGLDPVYTLATPDNPIDKNLLAGTAHLSQSTPAASFASLEKGLHIDIVHFASINDRDGFYLTARQAKENFKWSDLEGKDVLVDHLFQPMATLRYAMHLNGADFSKVNVIDTGNVDQMDSAFRSGQGDYVHQQGPAPQQLENDGLGTMAISVGEALGPISFSSLCATREWLKTDMALTFQQAYQQAKTDLVDMSSQQLADIIHGFLPNVDIGVLAKTLDDYMKLNTWSSDISINSDSYNNLLKSFLHSKLITKHHPIESCVVSINS